MMIGNAMEKDMVHDKHGRRNDLTAEFLRSILKYDPETGVFTYLQFRGGRLPGAVAGAETEKGYKVIRINRVEYRAHRLAWLYMTGSWPTDEIDHINGNRGDNRFSNLREADHYQSMQNRKLCKRNTSGFMGAFYNKQMGRWFGAIRCKGTLHHLGWFDSPEEAHEAYLAAKRELHSFQPVPRESLVREEKPSCGIDGR